MAMMAVMSAHHMVFRRRHLIESIVGVLRRCGRRAGSTVSCVCSALRSLRSRHRRGGIRFG
jgi:hypothetical protein